MRLPIPALAPGALRRGVVTLASTVLLVPTVLAVASSPAQAHPISVPSVPGGPVVIDGNDPGDHIAAITAYVRDVYTNLDAHVAVSYSSNGKVAVIGTCKSYLASMGTGETFDEFATASAVQGLFANIGANNYRHIHICSKEDTPNSLPTAVETELAQWGAAIVAHVNRGGGLFSTGHDYAWLRDLFPSITVTPGGAASSYVTTDGHVFFPNLAVNANLSAQNHWTFTGNETTPLLNLLTTVSNGGGLKVAIGGVTVRFPQLLLTGPTTAAAGSTQPYEFTAATADGTLLSSTAFTYTITDTAGTVTNGSDVTDANGQFYFNQTSLIRGDSKLRVQMNLGGSASGASLTTTWSALAAQPTLTAANVAGQPGSTLLTWPVVSSPYASITDYIIETSVDGTTWTTVNDGVSVARTYTVTGLNTAQQHKFRISAVTADGPGPASAVSTVLPQTITFPTQTDAPVSDGTRSVSGTATSGLTVDFSSTTPAVCTVVGTTVTYVSIGTCTVRAQQAGDATYQPAAAVNRSFVLTSPIPAPTAQTTTETGPVTQTVTVTPPAGGAVKLLDGGSPVDTLVVPGEGTYTVVPATGVITFTPEPAFHGAATPVTYRVSDQYGQTSTAAYTPTVLPVPLATPPAQSTSSNGAQSTTVAPPAGGSIALLEGGVAVTSVTVPGQGTYVVEPATGVITFTPESGFVGYPTPVSLRITDVYGQTASASYAPLVLPLVPVVGQPTSTGTGTTAQATTVTVPSGGSVTLLDAAGNPATTVTVPGQGTYVIDRTTGTITFTPLVGYAGSPTPVTFKVTDAYGQTAVGTYSPTVAAPAAPPAPAVSTSGAGTTTQSTQIARPSGGAVTLLDAAGKATSSVVVPGQGTYLLDTATGTITFVAAPGFSGTPTPVTFRVTDAYGQTGTGTYTPVVTSPAPLTTQPATPSLPTTGRLVVAPNGRVPVRCQLDKGRVDSCTVTISARVNGEQVVVGTATVQVPSGTRVSGVTVQVRLSAAGRALAAQPGGTVMTTVASVTQRGVTKALVTRAATTIVRKSVPVARSVFFDVDDAALRPAERTYLRSLKAKLAGVRTVQCTGHTDSQLGSAYNLALGRHRAATVCAFLTSGTKTRAVVVSTGENHAKASNATSRGRQLNRRTDIVLGY